MNREGESELAPFGRNLHLDNPQQDKPKDKGKIGSPGEEYSGLIADASIIASVNEVAKDVSDAGARDEIHRGVKAAVQALQKSAGKNVTIRE